MHEIEPDAATDASDYDTAGAAGPGVLRRALHRLTTPEHILEAENRQEQSLEGGGTPVERCRDRAQVCVVGMLRTVTIQPRGGSPSLQAELWDGSGSVDVVWIGRRRIPGIEPGRVIRAEGRMTLRDGRRVMFNPRYELRPSGS
ncbi:MAG TPA: OB-fold nucleic acid binding domain-containing protein [Acidothermaceae bacterium]